MTKAIDLGYRHIKSVELPNQSTIYDSLISDIVGSTTPALNSKSALIEYLEPNTAANAAFVGKRWIVGSSARNMANYKQATISDKVDIALKLALPTFTPAPDGNPIHIETLYTSLPDPERNAAQLVTTLQGRHRYNRNGVEIDLTIESVDVQPEGIGSYWLCLHHGLVTTGAAIGILDLGGKTACLTLVDEDGEIIPDSRLVFATGGTYALASMIAADPRLTTAVRDVPKTDVLLDAIASNSLRYGQTGISFGEYYQDYLQQWFQGILGELQTRWQKYFHRIGKVLVTGGSANLIKPLIANNTYFAIVPHAQLANCAGLLYSPSLRPTAALKVVA